MIEQEWVEARKNAVTLQELEAMNAYENGLCRQFLSGEISLEDFFRAGESIQRKGQVLMDTSTEMADLLRQCGLSDRSVMEQVTHEEAHYRTAQEAGLLARFGIQFVMYKGQNLFHNALVSVSFPKDISEATARRTLRAILIAPGEDMSVNDLAALPETEMNGVISL